ncbi:hypothetical protein [Mesorhizobium sp. B1-1-7]|uniref:hypothetical protein n=1 Tax=Mesorhizobium sp. B1-1-7 TaxID=2589977 RepID=UPI0011284FA4|nr:hypothetical protein [Mesorhizobium sp. B1-1-7]TPN53997.1 hypothetical protein FJ978_07795 [Mesorhizobium sp. B1-1-7]
MTDDSGTAIDDPITPAINWGEVAHKLSLVDHARILFGMRAARQMWTDLGLPSPAADRRNSGAPGGVIDFLHEATRQDMFGEIKATDLHSLYQSWAESRGIVPCGPSAFGKYAARERIAVRRSGGDTFYCGLRLKEVP